MKETVRARRRQLRGFAGPVAIADRLEKSKAMDSPIRGLAKAVRRRLRQGYLVTGDVEAPVITMEKGAHLDGRCRTTAEKPAEPSLLAVVPSKA